MSDTDLLAVMTGKINPQTVSIQCVVEVDSCPCGVGGDFLSEASLVYPFTFLLKGLDVFNLSPSRPQRALNEAKSCSGSIVAVGRMSVLLSCRYYELVAQPSVSSEALLLLSVFPKERICSCTKKTIL